MKGRMKSKRTKGAKRHSKLLLKLSSWGNYIDEAYQLSDRLRERGMKTVLGGLHVTACPEEAAAHADAVVVGSAEGAMHFGIRGEKHRGWRRFPRFSLEPIPARA